MKTNKLNLRLLMILCGIFLLSATSSVAQTVKADYRFNNTRASSVAGAPALTDIGSGTNAFVSGVVDGSPRTVLQFPKSNGVRLAPTTGVVPNDVYTIAVLFEFDATSGYRRVLDLADGANETALFVVNGNLVFYEHFSGAIAQGTATLTANTYHQVVLTRNAAGTVTAYLDGVQQFSFNDTSQYAVITANNALRFFRDGGAVLGEDSAGSVARIRLYDTALTASQVTALDRTPTPICTPAPVGLVSWYEGETNTLDSRSRNDGSSGGVAYAAGRVGQAFRIGVTGGGNSVQIPDSPSLDFTTALTIEAWVNPASPNTNVSFTPLVDKGYGSAPEATYLLNLNPNTLRVQMLVGTPSNFTFSETPDPLPLNTFTHIAGTYDGATVRIYVNGVLADSDATTITSLVPNTNGAAIGQSSGFANPFFGTIDEVSLYNRVLSASEIQSIFNSGAAGKCKPTATVSPTGQVAWLAGDGNAQDLSGNSNNGTLQNGAAFAVGRVGQTFSFDGSNDRVQLGNPASLQLQTFTIEAWIKRGSASVVTNNPDSINPAGIFLAYGNGGYGFFIDQPTNRVGLTHIGFSAAFSTSTITDTNYHHVAVVKNGGTVTFYIDGVANTPVSYNPTFSFTTNVAIGGRGDGNEANSFFGNIDEPSIYNRALTTTEIQSIVNAAVAGKLKQTTTSGTTATVGDATVNYSSAATRTTQQIPLETADFPAPTMGTHTGLIYDIASSASPSGTATVCFNLQSFNDATTFSRLRVLHFENTGWENRTSSSDFSSRTLCASVSSLSPFAIVLLPPTAAHVSVGGRVTMPNGKGVARARVSLIDPSGNTRFALTDFSGSYRFEAVEVGQTYVLSVSRKGYQFDQPTQVLFVNEDLNGVNFVALF